MKPEFDFYLSTGYKLRFFAVIAFVNDRKINMNSTIKKKQINDTVPRNRKLAPKPRLSASNPKIVGAMAPAIVAPENITP
jgi:hypothetical protein